MRRHLNFYWFVGRPRQAPLRWVAKPQRLLVGSIGLLDPSWAADFDVGVCDASVLVNLAKEILAVD